MHHSADPRERDCSESATRLRKRVPFARWQATALGLLVLLSSVVRTGAEMPLSSPARDGGWQVIGPGGGGAMFCPAISPHDPSLIFVACDMTGTYVSRDAGASWRMFNLQEIVREFAFDARDADVVYARGSCLWISRDRGASWAKLLPSPSEVPASVAVGDHADIRQFTRDGQPYRVTGLATDPEVSRAIYATAQVGTEQFILTSRDSGLSWTKASALIGSPLSILVDPRSPQSERRLIITQPSGLLIWQGPTLSQHPAPNETIFKALTLANNPAQENSTLYAVTAGENSRLLVTNDLGAHWCNLSANVHAAFPGTRQVDFRAIAIARNFPSTLYLSFKGLVTSDGRARLGVARSDDAGSTWNFSWLDPVVSHGSAGAKEVGAIPGWIDDHFGPDWGENPLAMTVDPQNPQHVVATDFGRTLQTTDGGRTWEQVYTRAKGAGSWLSRGLDVTNVYGVMFDPFDAQQVFMACTDIGLLRSRDGGVSWSPATPAPGLPPQWENTTYDLIFDPSVRGRLWAAMSGTHDLPREKMWRKHSPTQFGGGIAWSDDGGEHWKIASLDIGEAAVTDLLLDPESPLSKRTLYACAFGYGVLKSIDGGQTWQRRNRGLEGSTPLAWRIYQRTGDRALFLVVFRRSDVPTPTAEQIGAIYRSVDGADSWQKLSLPDGVTGPTSLIVDQLSPGTLLLSAWGRRSAQPASSDAQGGIYRSVDDGQSWTPVLNTDAHIATLTTDPRSATHYASGFNGKAYYSTDGGLSWKTISGFDFKWGQRVEADPQNPDLVYILTYGGGVWHGPLEPLKPAR